MKEPPLRTTCGGGSFVLRNVREGQPSDPATTTSSDCGAESGTWLWGPFVPVAVSRRSRERRVTLGVEGSGAGTVPYPFAVSRRSRETRGPLGEDWGRCCLRLQPSDFYFGYGLGLCLPGLAALRAQAIAVDKVTDGRPGNLAIDPKLELDQVALRGTGEGGELLVGCCLGVEVAAVG